MHCELIKDVEGRPIGTICRRGRGSRKVCRFCNRNFVTRECDFETGPKKTCDAGMCDSCTTPVGPDRDYCPDHMDEKPAPAQTELFFG